MYAPIGLGDLIERGLKFFGVTQERWIAFKEKHGYPPNCNCQARIDWFNQFHLELGVISERWNWLLRWYGFSR